MRTESSYQADLVKKLRSIYPGCFIIRNDPRVNQGVPDLLVLIENQWAMLEIKLSEKSPVQPNQAHYIKQFDNMGFAAFINPDNEVDVLEDLRTTLYANW